MKLQFCVCQLRFLCCAEWRGVKLRVEHEAAVFYFVDWHSEFLGRGANFFGCADEGVGLWVDPVATEAVAAEHFATVSDKGYFRQGALGNRSKGVVGVRVHANDHLRLCLLQHLNKALLAQQQVFMRRHLEDFQPVKIQVVQCRAFFLDQVVEVYAELINPSALFECLIAIGSDGRRLYWLKGTPLLNGACAHVVAAASAGAED